MNRFKKLAAFGVVAALTQISGPQLFGGSSFVIVQKLRALDQISANGPVANPSAPFVFSASGPFAMSFTPPGETTTAFASLGSKYGVTASFTTQAAMDSAFPDGSYTFEINGSPNFNLNLAGDLYPNSPQVAGGTWNGSGQLVADSTQDYTLNFNAFANYGTSGIASRIQVFVTSADGNTVNLNQSATSPATALSSYLIPAGTLAAGSIYQCSIEYDTAVAEDTTDVPGTTVVTIYSQQTSFMLVTSGSPTGAASLTQQPTSQQASIGSNVTLALGFTGGSSVDVMWFKNGIPINTSLMGSSLPLTNIQNSDAASYFAVVANGGGPYVQSNTATLSIITQPPAASAPVFTQQPAPQSISSGGTAVFQVAAQGVPSPTYQWYFEGGALSNADGISGATSSTLTVSGATAANVGSYVCVATNATGTVDSNSASLSLDGSANPGRLINISCRSTVGTGANIMIAGFVVGGTGTTGQESLLIRGSGPALVPFGVQATLADPQLQIFSGNTLLGTNDGWAGASSITSAAAAVGAFPWTSPSSHDAALLEPLSPGAYTAQIAGKSGDTGVSLVEIYDATPAGAYTPATPRIVNISARTQVGTGGNVLIAGFVVGGSTPLQVLIRASGPALAQFGVSGTLPDPLLQLFSGSSTLASNKGWSGAATISNAAASVGAFAWTNPSSNDSAILATLPPGAYTAQVSGASGDTGVSLVEIYEVP